jgi:hypothetical protein
MEKIHYTPSQTNKAAYLILFRKYTNLSSNEYQEYFLWVKVAGA